jgi:hypothetical protein
MGESATTIAEINGFVTAAQARRVLGDTPATEVSTEAQDA